MWRRPPAAALYYLSGYQNRSICSALSAAQLKINSFCTNTQSGSSYQCQESDSLKQSSTSLTEDDDFSELGAPVIINGFSSLKLMTEKPNCSREDVSDHTNTFLSSLSEWFEKPDCSRADVNHTNNIHPSLKSMTDEFSTSLTNDDDFSELKAPVMKNEFSSLKLMTEKPNRFMADVNHHANTILPSLKCMTEQFSTSLTKDDDFLELGAPEKIKEMASPELMMKKPNGFMAFKPKPTKDTSASESLAEESLPSIKDILSSLEKPPDYVETNPGDPATSRTNENSQDRSHIKRKGVSQGSKGNSNSVAVENVPTTVGISAVVEAISKFGKVYTASMRRTFSGFRCEIIFESAESRKRALKAGHVTVLGSELNIWPWSKSHLPVARNDRPKNATVRILGLSHDTTLDMIHSFCKSAGCLEGIAIKQWPAVDAVFRVNADSDLKDILHKLNGAMIDECRCSAKILDSDDNAGAAMPIDQDNRDKMGLEVSSQLKELHNQLNLQTLYAEDLYNLHLAIMHLESQSGTSTRDSSVAG